MQITREIRKKVYEECGVSYFQNETIAVELTDKEIEEAYRIRSEEYLKEDVVTYAISFNGKARYNLEIPADIPREEIEKMVLNHESSVRWLEGKTPKKIIVVPNKIVNIVI